MRAIFVLPFAAALALAAFPLLAPGAAACIPQQCCTTTLCDVLPEITCRTLVSEHADPVAAVAVDTCAGATGYVCTQPHVTNGIDGPISVVCGGQTSFVLP